MLVVKHCDRHITHLGEMDIFCSVEYIFKISFIFRVLHTITQNAQESK